MPSKKQNKTLYDKIFDNHIVVHEEKMAPVLYIDLHLLHEVTSPQAFENLRKNKLKVRRINRTFATIDHVISSTCPKKKAFNNKAQIMIDTLRKNVKEFNIKIFDIDSKHQGIVHVIAPELGLIKPGATVVCGDSHTATLGAFGCIAFGIGTSEVEHVLSTQCLMQKKLKTMQIKIEGSLKKGVSSKDLALYIIKKIGTDGGTGYAIEYTGNAISKMTMEQRMTLCNMSIEAGARVGLIAPDKTTFGYLEGRKYINKGKKYLNDVKEWKKIKTDKNATYDKVVEIDASAIAPIITYGIDPSMNIGVDKKIPSISDFKNITEKKYFKRALKYMNFQPSQSMIGKKIDYAFIGSCTNARLSDLVEASKVVKEKKVNKNVKAIVVPGSQQIKKIAEEQGIAKIFIKAGFEWRSPSCSYCLGINGDLIPSKKYCISTSNRNFEGRQGKGARTILANPVMTAIAAIEGMIVDIRKYI